MKNANQLLLIGLFIAFGVGFGIGAASTSATTVSSPYPVNYDPARSVLSDALKTQQDKTEFCYMTMVKKLEAEIRKEPSH